ncbi:V-type ATP synthase subunit I, partial [mine drainage metagenome]
MEKIRIISLIRYREQVVTILHDMRVMQLEPVSPDLLQYMKASDLTAKVEVANAELQKLKSYMGILPKQPVKGRKKFTSLEEALGEARSIDLTDRLRILKEKEADISTDIKDIRNRMETTQPLIGMDVDLSIFNTSFTKSYIVTSPLQNVDPDALRRLPSSPSVVPTPNGQYVVTIPVLAEKDLAKVANELGYSLLHIPELNGKPADYYEDLVASLKNMEKALSMVNGDYQELSKKNYEEIATLEEQLRIEVSKLEAAQRAFSTSE